MNIKNVYFIHIPKTAGSSLEEFFYENGGCISSCYFRKYNKSIIKNKKYKNISLYHIPFQFLSNDFIQPIIKNDLIFTVVRNPYTRIISDFKFWINYYNQRINKNNLTNKEKYLINNIKNIYKNNFDVTKENLNKFVKNVLNNKDYYIILDGHFIPMYEYIFIKNNNKIEILPQSILKMEDLDNDFDKFVAKYNIKLKNKILPKINISENKLSIKDLDKESLKLINKNYHNDFKFFKYKEL